MSYINKVRIDMQVYDLNLKHVGDENLTLVKEEKLNNEIQGRVLNAPTLNPLQARSQDVRP